jgi:uncharacterized protein YheU (UPF0270 family)
MFIYIYLFNNLLESLVPRKGACFGHPEVFLSNAIKNWGYRKQVKKRGLANGDKVFSKKL